MAAEPSSKDLQIKSPEFHKIFESNGNLEVSDDDFDFIKDENINAILDNSDVDDDYLYGLDDFELKDGDPDSLALLTSVLYDQDMPVSDDGGDDDDGRAKEFDASEVSFEGLQDNESKKDTDVDNDQVKAILKEIREEIEKKVRDEMKDELNSYHRRIKAIENGCTSETNPFEKNLDAEGENLEDMDPKLREAIIKMRKLDKILLEKIKIEREVKRNRIILERRMRQEIAELTKGVNIPQDIRVNTEKFLALEPPASHNEGITIDDEPSPPPVFQTQIEENEELWGKRDEPVHTSQEETGTDGTARADSPLKTTSRSGRSQAKPETKSRKQMKDFIKRNKELAGHADQSIPMTDDEKKRLAELLEGLDELSEPEDAASDINTNQMNAHQVTLQPGEGYFPDSTEMESLSNIDDQLKTLMPKEDYQSLLSPRPVPQQPLFSRVGNQTPAAATDQPERFGERALLQTKDERELKARLQEIEQELAKFKAQTEEDSAEESHLTDEQLDNLLDECARNLAASADTESADLSARSVASSRLSLLENPPKLTNEQLEQLLIEAHFPLSSRLLALRENEERLLEEECGTETIKAETWKTIQNVNLDESDYLDKKFPDLAEIDRELQSFIDTVNMNTSNNHKRSTVSKSKDTKHRRQHDEEESEESVPILSPSTYSACDLIQSSMYAGTASGGLPRISQSNGISYSEISLDSRSSIETPVFLSRDNSDEMIRLPDISTKSFLVHAHQGMDNANDKGRSNLPTRLPVDFMCNDLFQVRSDDVSDDTDRKKEHSNGYKSASRSMNQPKSKLPKDWQ
ncbi:hypothetical protein BsWGS_24411 [Bradybaena similaris]